MASRYGDCCMGAECSMPDKTVTFYHRCIKCSGFLHVVCGVTDMDDVTTCLKCVELNRKTVGGKSPRKAVVTFLEAQRTTGATTTTPDAATGTTEATTATPDADADDLPTTPTLTPPTPGALPPKTTSRKKQKRDGTETRIGLGKRIKVTRGDIFHVLSPNQRQHIPQDIGNSYPLFGTVIGGGGNKTAKKGWDIELDVLPADEKKVLNVSRNKLSVLAPGEDKNVEKHLTQSEKLHEIISEEEEKKKKMSPMNKCQADFAALSKDVRAEAKVFEMTYGKNPSECLQWEILGDQEHHIDNAFVPPTSSDVVNSCFDFEADLEKNFFDHIFPSVTGHAAIIDKYLADPRATYYETVKNHKITFLDDSEPDPDWKIKQCYLLIIAAAAELENGVENLWKSGMKRMRRSYPDFGRFMGINEMQAFCSAAPYAWADPQYWYLPERDTPWEMFLPCIYGFNDRRQRLIKTMMIMLDESMSGWRPKTSKLGGLPNITFEPRKPTPLGTMFRNGAECFSGILVFQDAVQAPEVQSRKEFYNEPSHLPGNPPITAHAAEVLRQVKGARIPKGGWVGGDSWFGSVLSAVEVKVQFSAYSTWVIKQNTDFFPMQALHSVLKARYGDRPAGHWVVFRATISGVTLIAVCYAWSHSSTTYFLSTCGSTNAAKTSYTTHFEDEFGTVGVKHIPQPSIKEWFYDFLPLIDEHNKHRQSLLRLEKKWPTKSCWFRLLTTLIGMCVVDMYRVYLNHDKRKYDKMDIIQFADEISLNLRPRTVKKAPTLAAALHTLKGQELRLERITNEFGETCRPPTDRQMRRGRATGNSITAHCFICRKYMKKQGTTNYVQTAFRCLDCKMPLCKADRTTEKRPMSCYYEHKCSEDSEIGCTDVSSRKRIFPKDKQLLL